MVDVPSYFRVDNQVAVVTGGASGIGEATAQVLAAAGAAVVVGDIDEEGASRTAKAIEGDGGRALALGTDTARRSDVEARGPGGVGIRPARHHVQRGRYGLRQAGRRDHRGRLRPAVRDQPQGRAVRLSGRGGS